MGHKFNKVIECVFCKKDLSDKKGSLKILKKGKKEVYSCPHHPIAEDAVK